MQEKRDEKGLTLMELMIAVVLTALLSLALYTTYSIYLNAWQKGEARIQRYQNARLALDRMARELKGAMEPNTLGSNVCQLKGVNSTYTHEGQTLDNDAITFVTTLPRSDDAFKVDVVQMAYHIDTGDQTLVRIKNGYENSSSFDFTVINGPPTSDSYWMREAAYHIVGLNFRYSNDGGRSWSNTYNAQTAGYLPNVIEIEVSAQSDRPRYNKIETLQSYVYLRHEPVGP